MRNVTIGGKSFQVAPEPADYWGWITEGRYNHEWRVYDAYLKPEHTFIDLGAWVGGHSLYASLIAKRLISVEPDPVAYKILVENLSLLSPRPETSVISKAITGSEGEVTIGSGFLGASTTRLNLNAGGGIGAAVPEHTVQVCSTTLRKLLDEVDGPLFIKMDVEGAEEEILRDVDFFAERKPTLLVELHPFWWRDEQQAWKDFEAVRALYPHSKEVPHKNSKTWVMNA